MVIESGSIVFIATITPVRGTDMSYSDLRGWLKEVDRIGELKHITGAHWDKEIGGISELMAERSNPALLFDEIPGYPKGFRVLSNPFQTCRRVPDRKDVVVHLVLPGPDFGPRPAGLARRHIEPVVEEATVGDSA